MTQEQSAFIQLLKSGDRKAIARAITIVENELQGWEAILQGLSPAKIPVVGITGPPGAGKSTLINSLLRELTQMGKNVAIVAVDPTSPFNYGSLLGDRLRMAEHFNNNNVFIRSLATRGSLGGLSEKIIEITDVLRSSNFDMVIVETVGVGQSEVEIAGLADTTVVVVVPESGDEVQGLKSGIMEIADIFVVNKADRQGADTLVNSLKQLMHHSMTEGWTIPVLKTIASQSDGVHELIEQIEKHFKSEGYNEKKIFLLTEKVMHLIRRNRMKDVNKEQIKEQITKAAQKTDFNLYLFTNQLMQNH
ncbi:MAG: methylmalonyl Co-A mutase-associated GTPase MeaB [Bacteroidetes bacterium]|nr:methylmalonyl Co-A mutase-associated GTPase MeaB [Bacteroidota bacterium]MBL0032815.1 methylmalonyl Co-A mutase-associated GTPase MeaB [Bacteroidota bacterium]